MKLVENKYGKMELPEKNKAVDYAGFRLSEKRSEVREKFKTTGMSIWEVSLCEQRAGDQFDVKHTVLADSLELALAIKDDWILDRVKSEERNGATMANPLFDEETEQRYPGYEDYARVAEVMLREECGVTVRLKEMRYVYRTEEVVLPVAPGGASLGIKATAVSFITPPEELDISSARRAERLHTEEELPAPELVEQD